MGSVYNKYYWRRRKLPTLKSENLEIADKWIETHCNDFHCGNIPSDGFVISITREDLDDYFTCECVYCKKYNNKIKYYYNIGENK